MEEIAKTVRPISIEVGILPRAHGSGLFTRGETQAVVVATLGTEAEAQKIDNLISEGNKTFMLHYNFPPFSVGGSSSNARSRKKRNWSWCIS